MLADRAKVNVRGGDGGNGCLSFRREKHVPKGGPDGGDGGRGGDVIIVASRQVRDLSGFLQKIHFRARGGGHGSGANRRGADGPELRVRVPVGTEVRSAAGELLADLVRDGDRVVIARGGEGGRGNSCFVSSRRRAPHFAERGLPGEELWVELLMKLIADAGLVGLPNAGKSSLLAALTRARPRIAAYPFTTVEPNLGTLALDDRVLVLADIPGLVEGAGRGLGLGHRFLAHVERTATLVYVVDASTGAGRVAEALRTVYAELEAFRPALVRRPALIVLTKRDLIDADVVAAASAEAASATVVTGWPVVAVSCVTGEGIDALVAVLDAMTPLSVMAQPAAAAEVLRPGRERVASFSVKRHEGGFRVRGEGLERLVAKADLDNSQAVAYLQEVMERAGVSDALRRAGAQPGDTVVIGESEFEFA